MLTFSFYIIFELKFHQKLQFYLYSKKVLSSFMHVPLDSWEYKVCPFNSGTLRKACGARHKTLRVFWPWQAMFAFPRRVRRDSLSYFYSALSHFMTETRKTTLETKVTLHNPVEKFLLLLVHAWFYSWYYGDELGRNVIMYVSYYYLPSTTAEHIIICRIQCRVLHIYVCLYH